MFAPLALLAFVVNPASANTLPEVVAEYNSSTHEFFVTVQPVTFASYKIQYTTPQGVNQEAYGETSANENNVFQTPYIPSGIESGGDRYNEQVVGGTITIDAKQVDGSDYHFYKTFTIRNGALVLESEPLSQTEVTWIDNGDGSFTWEKVQLNQTLTAPQNDKVTLTFTSLPENPGNVTIREITLTDEQVIELGALSNTAYDITSTMEDGTFTYDLTLPNPAPEKEVDVKFSEDGSNFGDLNGTERTHDTVTIRGLNHFTVFVVVDDTPGNGNTDPVFVANPGQNVFTIDNGDDGFSTTGTWVTVSESSCYTKAIDNDILKTGDNNAKAIWSFQVPVDGSYVIDAHWVKTLLATTKAQYRVFDEENNELSFKQHSQERNGLSCVSSDWQSITNSPLTLRAGETYRVELKGDNPNWLVDVLAADAIRVQLTELPAPETIGWNVQAISNNEGKTDVDLACTPEGVVTVNQPVSHVWTQIPGENVKYQRQNIRPDNSQTSILGPYANSYSGWGSFGLGDGTYQTRVRAWVDINNNNQIDDEPVSDWSEYCAITLDTTGPTAPTITFPNNEDYFSSQPILNQWTGATDPSGIKEYRIEYQYDDAHTFPNAPYRIVSGTSRNHTPASWEEGGVKIRVQAFDTLGNEGAWSEWVHYYYDHTEPSSSFTAPVDDSQWNQQITITGSSDDVEYPGPKPGALVKEIQLFYQLVGDGSWTPLTTVTNSSATDPFNWTYDWTPPAEGTYNLKVTAIDMAGNVESTDYVNNVTYDTTAPDVPVLNQPEEGFATRGIAFNQTWFPVTDAVLYEYHSCNTDPGDTGTTCASPKYSNTYTGTTKNVGAGQPNSHFWWQVRAKDAAGNWSAWSETRELIIDNDAPNITLNEAFPATSNKLTGFTSDTTPTFAGSTTDEYLAGIKTVEYRITDTSGEVIGWTTADTIDGSVGDITRTFTFTTSALTDGEYTVHVRSVDRASNTSSVETQDFVIDTDAPNVELTAPTDGDFVSGTVNITGNISDTNHWRYYFVIQKVGGGTIHGGTVYNSSSSIPVNYAWNTTTTTDGEYVIKLESRDKAGNKDAGSSQWVYVTVDNEAPVSVFTSPTPGSSSGGAILIAGETTDNFNVDTVLLQYAPYDGAVCGAFADITTLDNATNDTPFSWGPYSWTPTGVGSYCLTAHGTDLAGNVEASPQVIITYNPTDIIAGYKFHDFDQDGDWDSNEPGLENWTINASQVIEEGQSTTTTDYATTTTDENGYYEFEVPVGKYQVSENLQSGWTQTAPVGGVCEFDITDPNWTESEYPYCNFGNYQIPVTTDNNGGDGGSSGGTGGTASAPVCSATAPGVPVGLTVSNTTANSVTLTWSKPTGDVSHYALEFIRLSDGARYGTPAFGDSNTTSYTITNLSGQAAYRFELMAVNDCKPGDRAVVTSTQISGPIITGEGDQARPQGDDGQVLGVNTEDQANTETGEIASGVTDNNLLGSVLGASTEDCTVPGWWWTILAIYLVALIIIHAMFSGGIRTGAHLLAALITAGVLYKILCMPWFWIAVVLILAVLSEALPWLLSQNSKDPFSKTFEKSTPSKSAKRK